LNALHSPEQRWAQCNVLRLSGVDSSRREMLNIDIPSDVRKNAAIVPMASSHPRVTGQKQRRTDMNDQNCEPAKERTIVTHIAVWQFMAFVILLCLVWISEIMDLPAMFFAETPSGLSIARACTLSAAVIICAIVAVGNTYVQQRHILKGLFILCSACSKIRINRQDWEKLDRYLEKNTLASFSTDLCPECFEVMEREVTGANVARWKSETEGEQTDG